MTKETNNQPAAREKKTNSNGVASPVHRTNTQPSANIKSSIDRSIGRHKEAIDILSKR